MAVMKDSEFVKVLGGMLIEAHKKGNMVESKRKINGHEVDLSTMSGVKKGIREIYKDRMTGYSNQSQPEFIINSFVKPDHSGEVVSKVWILKNTPEAMAYVHYHIGVEETKNHYDYSPTGLWFDSRAYITETAERIFVRKISTLDC